MTEETTEPKGPMTLVVRYGYLRQLGEFTFDGERFPGCGAKVVIRTRRGTELGEVLSTTCDNGQCATSISRDQLLNYIQVSGGDEYPFTTDGRVLRVATPQDRQEHQHLEQMRAQYLGACKELIGEMQLPMRPVEVEPLLGGEMVTFYFTSEERVDFRGLVKQLASRFRTRIQMHQVGARDEARLVADYETCGQQCCCKQFMKVLRPVSMGSAKMQKATLDPGKISGRCGRLKCCMRYEHETYEALKKRLPRLNTRVRTSEGEGIVVETMILTQLVKVRLDNDRFIAVAVDELNREPSADPQRRPEPPQKSEPMRMEPAAPAADANAGPVSNEATQRNSRRRRGRRSNRPSPETIGTNGPTSGATAAQPNLTDAPAEDAPAGAALNPDSNKPAGVGTMGRRRRGRRGRGRGTGGAPPQSGASEQ